MAILNESLAYLLDPAFQVESVAGKPLVGGYAEVFLAGTNSKVITCQDFDGTNNPFRIPLKNDGRAIILVQPQNHYDIYFYDSYGNLAFSRLNVIPAVGGELHLEGKKLTNIRNDDGTLDVSLNAASQNLNTYTINSNHTPLGVESPLYFKEDTEESVVIGLDESIIDEKVAEAAKGFATSADIAAAVAAEAQIRSTNDNTINQKAEQAKTKADAVDTYVKEHEAEWSKGTTYTAGANININAQNVISGKDWSGEIAAVGAVAEGKQDKLTAGSNIKIENNTISVTGEMGKIYTGVGTINVNNTKNEISIDDSGYAKSSDLTGKQDKLTNAQLSAISSVSGKQDKLTAGTNIGINGNVISVTGELGKTYTGENYVNVNNDTNKIGLTDTAKSKLDSFVGEFDLSAGENINFRKVGNTVFIDGQQGGGGQTYFAGANIDITNNVISGKNWNTEIESATSGKQDKLSNDQLSAISSVSSKADKSEIPSLDGYATESWVTNTAITGKQDKLTDYTPDVWNAKQDALSNAQLSAISSVSGKQDKLTDYNPTLWNTVSNKQDILTDYTPDVWNAKQDALTDYTPDVWNTVTGKQNALDWTPTIEDI